MAPPPFIQDGEAIRVQQRSSVVRFICGAAAIFIAYQTWPLLDMSSLGILFIFGLLGFLFSGLLLFVALFAYDEHYIFDCHKQHLVIGKQSWPFIRNTEIVIPFSAIGDFEIERVVDMDGPDTFRLHMVTKSHRKFTLWGGYSTTEWANEDAQKLRAFIGTGSQDGHACDSQR